MTMSNALNGGALEILAMAGPRPLAPRVSLRTREFWARLEEGKFLVTRCAACGDLSFPPQGRCTACGHAESSWLPVSGSGVVYSATVVHAAPAFFSADAPYVLAIVDLDEGVRLVTRWIGLRPACNQRARLVILKHDDGVLFGATAES